MAKVLKTQKYVREYDYRRYWAAELNLSELLQQALDAAGISLP